MTSAGWSQVALTFGLLGGLGATTAASLRPLDGDPPAADAAAETARASERSDTTNLTVWAKRVPFRRSRSPAAERFDARRVEQPAVERPAPPPRPTLVLSGLLLGEEPLAIIEGFPGIEGARTVRTRERVGELLIARITASSVVVKGMDTTWTLKVREIGP